MNAMFDGPIGPQRAVGPKTKARLPGPAIQPFIDRQPDRPMSDLQHMLQEEIRQHQQAYNYAHGDTND